MASFTCATCGDIFEVKDATLAKYPGWTPRQCMKCRPQKSGTSRSGGTQAGAGQAGGARGRASVTRELDLTTDEVLARFTDGPDSGVFTDGAAHPNPGEGGWGAVYVVEGKIIAERNGHEPDTTNNRMELTALIQGFGLVPPGQPATMFTDSELCVNTITKWAPTWERNGWKKKGGEIKNLALVQTLYRLARARPEITLKWIKAHAGSRWNEYADALASAYRRDAK